VKWIFFLFSFFICHLNIETVLFFILLIWMFLNRKVYFTSFSYFYYTMFLFLCSLVVKYDTSICYVGDRGTTWHAHFWSCNSVFITSHLHASCPPWSTWLCRSSLGMFHFKLFALIYVFFLIHKLFLSECTHSHYFIS